VDRGWCRDWVSRCKESDGIWGAGAKKGPPKGSPTREKKFEVKLVDARSWCVEFLKNVLSIEIQELMIFESKSDDVALDFDVSYA
jgi:hypothetical protein